MFCFQLNHLVEEKTKAGTRLLRHQIKCAISISKRQIISPGIRGFSLGMKLRPLDESHVLYARKRLHTLCTERNISVTPCIGTPEIVIGDITGRSHGRRIVTILDLILTPYYLESNDHMHEQLHSRNIGFPVSEISVFQIRHLYSGRKKKASLLYRVPFETV